ncbi:MAG: replication-associated recombination protein A [Clostridia bacterium]|nr:replication-associated recombination protein A [Clostridia bacterium]
MNFQKRPLAEMMRPESFDDMVGQTHLFGKNGVIRKMTSGGYLPNMIFFGPPGTGKTTAAGILAASTDMTIHRLNATTASLADVKEVCAQTASVFASNGILLYLDEIQYFNKKQQQSLLEYIEDGRITLIASTTENPYMYVYNAIISRSAVFEFKPVEAKDMLPALRRALEKLNNEYESDKIASDDTLLAVASAAAGDVRRSLNLLENCYFAAENEIDTDILSSINSNTVGNFDKDGTVHYDLLSALQKSIRGSDPDATLFYLARLLDGGDLLGACRRLQVIASEDIGLAYPIAAAVTDSCVNSALRLGMPEAAIPLSHAAALLATAPKSNSAHIAYEAALADVREGKGRELPKALRQVNNFDGYKYPHDYPDHYIKQQYLPDDVKNNKYFTYGISKNEVAARDYWNQIKKKHGEN